MKTCSKCKVNKDILDFHKKSKSGDARSSRCKSCAKIDSRESKRRRYAADPDKFNKYARAHYAAHRDVALKRIREYAATHPRPNHRARTDSLFGQDRHKSAKPRVIGKRQSKVERAEYHRQWYLKNKERIQSRKREYADNNSHKIAAWAAERRARIQQATPKWADAAAIEAVYLEAARLTETTGTMHHVDHHYPLNGRNVCGLHVETNLRVLTQHENCSKNNRHPDDI